MAKTITFEHEGKTYTLEFTRNAVATLERQGFKLDNVEDKPLTTLPALFSGAFLAHHRYIKPEVVTAILKKMPNKMDLFMKLAEMYNETVASFVDDPEESEGNIEWGASW